MTRLARFGKPEEIARTPARTLFRVALALAGESKQDAGRRLGVTASTVTMCIDPGGVRPLSAELAQKIQRTYGIPADSWEKKQ